MCLVRGQKRASRTESARAKRITIEDLQSAVEAALARANPAATVTFKEHWEWWEPRFLSRMESARDFKQRVTDYLLPAIGELTESTLLPDVIELTLARLEGRLAAGTLNHIRSHGRKIINDALRSARWRSANPFAAVRKRRTKKRSPYILTIEEVRRVIGSASEDIGPRWALLLGLGLRFGELRNIRTIDLDEVNARLFIRKTKTNVERTVPVQRWLLSMLAKARGRSKGEWLFPSRGHVKQLGKGSKPGKLLDRALRRAAVVAEFRHWCRGRDCDFEERRGDGERGPCPRCFRTLHVRGIPRKVTVHDLRHVTISLLSEAGVHPSVISKVVGHSTVVPLVAGSTAKMTQGVYTHLREGFIRTELEKLDLTPDRRAL